jgi:hypothetical protein
MSDRMQFFAVRPGKTIFVVWCRGAQVERIADSGNESEP